MITTDELKVQLADYGTAVKDLEEALAIDASRKRVQELEHTMSRPGFYDDAELSKKVFDEVGDLKGKLNRFEKLQGLYDDAETMLVMLDEEYDPDMVPEAEEAVNAVGKAVDELQLMTMLNGEYDHSNAILTFHAGTGGTEAQDWAEMLYRMYNKWAQAHGMTVEVLDYQDGDEAGMKSASMMVKGANAYGLLKSENGVHRLVGEVVLLGPVGVHTVEHLGPVLGLGAAGTGVEGQDGVVVVVLAVEHRHELQLVDGLLDALNGLLTLGGQGGIVLFLDHFQQRLGFLILGGQLAETLELVLHFAHLTDDFLAAGLVIVEAGHRHLVLQLGQALFAGLDGQCVAQVIHGGLHAAELCFQFVNRNHISFPSSHISWHKIT